MRRASPRAAALALALTACASTAGTATEPAVSYSPLPEPTPLLRFAVVGDFGTGAALEYEVARRMCRWRRGHGFRLVVTTGDNVYPDGGRDRFRAAFFRPMRCLLENGVRFRAALGNHDVRTNDGRPELREPAFGMEGRNYVVRRNGVRFVIANSTPLNRDRLRRMLRTREGDRWTVVVFHHPVFSPGTTYGSTPGYRPELPRMFRRKGVDLVLNGHDHLYAVTKPLRRIRYAVTGGGGAALYPCGAAWFSERCAARHHFLYVVAWADRIAVRAVPIAGPPFDRFRAEGRAP